MEHLLKVPDSVVERAERSESKILFLAIVDPTTGNSRQVWGLVSPVEAQRILADIGMSQTNRVRLNIRMDLQPKPVEAEEECI